jgi:hypothetical protein
MMMLAGWTTGKCGLGWTVVGSLGAVEVVAVRDGRYALQLLRRRKERRLGA